MEEKKHLLMYVEHIFTTLGVSLLVITVTCAVVGEEAQEYSTMFALGGAGIPAHRYVHNEWYGFQNQKAFSHPSVEKSDPPLQRHPPH